MANQSRFNPAHRGPNFPRWGVVMQTLGVANQTPQSDSRLKNIFWPTIRNSTDVDTLGSQGYWICAIVSILGALSAAATGHPIAGFFLLLYIYFGGVGVRQHSLYAAAAVFVMYLLNTAASPGILSFFICVVLLSVLRATWIASFWEPKSAEAEMPVRFSETWGDKFADKFPAWLWPKVRIAYYIYSLGFLALTSLGLVIVLIQRYDPQLLRFRR